MLIAETTSRDKNIGRAVLFLLVVFTTDFLKESLLLVLRQKFSSCPYLEQVASAIFVAIQIQHKVHSVVPCSCRKVEKI